MSQIYVQIHDKEKLEEVTYQAKLSLSNERKKEQKAAKKYNVSLKRKSPVVKNDLNNLAIQGSDFLANNDRMSNILQTFLLLIRQ